MKTEGTKTPAASAKAVLRIVQAENPVVLSVSESDIADNTPAAKTVNLMLESAIRASVTDIHIEPKDGFLQVRYRVDGLLRPVSKLPLSATGKLIGRVKQLASLQIDHHRTPQNGHLEATFGGKNFSLQISTVPVEGGEKATIRILPQPESPPTFEDLGLWGPSLDILNSASECAHGLIIIAGQRGSGTSTTLYSVLNKLNTPDISIATIEDPIEYKIAGATQVQINSRAKLGYANSLRALVKQDANIIMTSELHDSETAKLCAQSAMGGHTICTAIRADSSAGAILQLLSMGVEPFMAGATVKTVVSQRLVRKLCPECKKSYKPDREIAHTVFNTLGIKHKKVVSQLKGLEELALKQGIGKNNKQLALKNGTLSKLYKANPKGCPACKGTGYSGRIGIFEVMPITNNLQTVINTAPTLPLLYDNAIAEGMLPLQADGLVKALRGITSIEEVVRVAATQLY
ncbi:MAG: GspE/PulE family protein [Candidatus Woesebacteria bacterium]|jgi:type II secretory ATPase GspE/PulE/Tfp pilus assembly ATPase PilB-like protein